MTKEELDKEATEYALEWGDKTDGTYACCRDGYIAGAEPREERITELEKELQWERDIKTELAEHLGKANDKVAELEKENAKLQAKIDDWQSEYIELENFKNNEIAELKAQIEKMKCCQNCKFEDNDCIEEPCSTCTRCLGDIKRKGNSDKWELQEN